MNIITRDSYMKTPYHASDHDLVMAEDTLHPLAGPSLTTLSIINASCVLYRL